jgi:hypothetical protein
MARQLLRDELSTHSAYAVMQSLRVRLEILRILRRDILMESASGTYCSSSSAMP